ncbi:FACT complex subunit SSRP1-like, partial [Trifolium medium]|nr:FACT complex subunit SSRP1-like [Trifolium medium]
PPSNSKASSSKKKSKDADEDGKKRKPKKKKDPNAPKRALSGFMFFSQMERENIKKTNPGISFTDVGRVLGEKWKKMSVEEKEPYEAKARVDKIRYKDEISGYKNQQAQPQPMNIDSGNESDSA